MSYSREDLQVVILSRPWEETLDTMEGRCRISFRVFTPMEVVSEIKTLSFVLVAWDGNGVKAGWNPFLERVLLRRGRSCSIPDYHDRSRAVPWIWMWRQISFFLIDKGRKMVE